MYEEDSPEVAGVHMSMIMTDDRYYKMERKVLEDTKDHRTKLQDILEDVEAWKLVVLKVHCAAVLTKCHDNSTADHLDRYKTCQRVALDYY